MIAFPARFLLLSDLMCVFGQVLLEELLRCVPVSVFSFYCIDSMIYLCWFYVSTYTLRQDNSYVRIRVLAVSLYWYDRVHGVMVHQFQLPNECKRSVFVLVCTV